MSNARGEIALLQSSGYVHSFLCTFGEDSPQRREERRGLRREIQHRGDAFSSGGLTRKLPACATHYFLLADLDDGGSDLVTFSTGEPSLTVGLLP